MSLIRRLRLFTHPWRLLVERLPPDAPLPAPPEDDSLFALVRSPESLTVVRAAEDGGAARVWRALEVAGPFHHDETGIIAAVAMPLAEAGVSIFAVNSYETDFVLVPEQDLERARDALARAGHQLG